MHPDPSHGPLSSRRSYLLWSLSGALALIGASLLWIEFHQPSQKELEAHEREIAARTQRLAESIESTLGDLRTHAYEIQLVLDRPPRTPGTSPALSTDTPLLHWAQIEPDAAGKMRITKEIHLKNQELLKGISIAESLEAIRTEELSQRGVSVSIRTDAIDARKTVLAVAFKDLISNQAHTWLVHLPASTAFPMIHRHGNLYGGIESRAYLITDQGQVIAHSQLAYVGSHFRRTDVFQKGIKSVFASTRSGLGLHHAIDQSAVLASYRSLEGLPFAVVAESTTFGKVASQPRWNGAGAIAAGCWTLSILVGFLGWKTRGRTRRMAPPLTATAVAQTPFFGAETAGPPSFIVEGEIIPITPASDTPQMMAAPQKQAESPTAPAIRPAIRARKDTTLQKAEEYYRLVNDYEMEVTSTPHLNQVLDRLVQTASRLSDSPVLYFSFRESTGTAYLLKDWGFMPGEAPAAMAFPIPVEVQYRILQGTREGKISTLNQYQPLARAMLSQLEIAHFEAWAITGYPQTGGPKTQPRLLGVLVLLHAGVQSKLNRDLLIRMIRTTSLVYENVFGNLRAPTL